MDSAFLQASLLTSVVAFVGGRATSARRDGSARSSGTTTLMAVDHGKPFGAVVGGAGHAGCMDVLRTPEDRFAGLPNWTYTPSYVLVDGIRIAYYDVGDPESPVVLLLHGEPTWSYLYRSFIPPLLAAELRVIAIDLVGFGQSDKPVSRGDYSYQRHVGWLESVVIDHLELTDITMFCHDWGGLLGLRLVASYGRRFARVVSANTFLPTGDQPPGGDFLSWREYSQSVPVLQAGNIVNSACMTNLAPETIAGYDAPFPDERFKAGARQFPVLVPITPDDPASRPNAEAWRLLRRYDKPFLTVFSDSDPVTAGQDVLLQQLIPGSAGQPHKTVRGGHFLQEDAGPEIVSILIDFIRHS
jgi:haloalkane dehalogenase